MENGRLEIRNTGMYVMLAAVAALIVLVCLIPMRISADGVSDPFDGYRLLASNNEAADQDMVDDYSLSVKIEDEKIPLSAGNTDYRGMVVPVVVCCLLITLAVGYMAWFGSHKKRIASLMVMGITGDVDINGMDDVSILHPIKTIRFENELENRVVSSTTKGV